MTSNGDKVLYIDFEESWDALVSCMLSTNLDLRPAREAGKLEFLSLMPESQGIEEHLIQVFRLIESFKPDHLILDAISACRRMGSANAAFDYLLRLINYCKQLGITTLLTNLTSAYDNHEVTGIDLSSVIDTVLVLTNMQSNGRFKRELTALKSRGRAHSSRIHEFKITNSGVIIDWEEEQHAR